nr:MAG TPA: hypothetical protein [Caudoviricetes sp.]
MSSITQFTMDIAITTCYLRTARRREEINVIFCFTAPLCL